MERSADSKAHKSSGVRKVTTAVISTHSINEAFADMLRPFSAKEIARRLKLPSARTVEKWKEGATSPQARHVVAMLNDDELCARLLEAAGRPDLANDARLRVAKSLVKALESEGK